MTTHCMHSADTGPADAVRSLSQAENVTALEARVAALVAELGWKDRMLVQQNRTAVMGEMLDTIAHQLRQPLNNLAMIIQGLQIEYDSGALTREEFHGTIRDAMAIIMKMSGSIREFPSFLREEKDPQRFSISEMVRNVMPLVSPSLQAKNIRVEVEADTKVDAVGRQNECAQVLLGILSHCRSVCRGRFAADPRIDIRVTRENGHGVLIVRDNFGAVPEDALPGLFAPAISATPPDYGAGFGLYISKILVEQRLGGRLSARNVDGGMEFRIEV